MPRVDPRLVVGSTVHSKASAVLCKAECKRLFGSLHDSKLINGEVLVAKKVSTMGSNQKLFAKNVVDVKFTLFNGKIKIVSLGLAQVKAGPAETEALTTQHPVINPNDAPLSPLSPTEEPPNHQPSPPAESPTQPASGSFSGASVCSDVTEESELPNSPNLLAPDPTVTCHGVEWFVDNDSAKVDRNGAVVCRKWFVRDRFGTQYYEDSDLSHQTSIFGYFDLMFPLDAIETILAETNIELVNAGHVASNKGELLRFFGVMVTITRLEFDNRRDLCRHDRHQIRVSGPVPHGRHPDPGGLCAGWAGRQTGPVAEIGIPDGGRTGFTRRRDQLRRCPGAVGLCLCAAGHDQCGLDRGSGRAGRGWGHGVFRVPQVPK